MRLPINPRANLSIFAFVLLAHNASGQVFRDTLPASAYARAEQFMSHRAAGLMFGNRVDMKWLDEDRFWYSVATPDGTQWYLVDPVKNTKQRLVDPALLAQGISATLDTVVEARRLTLGEFELSKDEKSASFNVGARRVSCDLATNRCVRAQNDVDRSPGEAAGGRGGRGGRGGGAIAGGAGSLIRSPDKKWDAFIRNNDVYARQVGCTEEPACEIRLTSDGSAEYGYGRNPGFQAVSRARRGTASPPYISWSPDSRRIVVNRLDTRGVGRTYLISSTATRPELFSLPQAYPGDSVTERSDLYIINIETKERVRVDVEPIPFVRGGPVDGLNGPPAVQWQPNASSFFFLTNDRGPTRFSLLLADAKTGRSRRIVTDSIGPRLASISEYVIGNGAWRLSRGNDVYWYSERDGGSHLYKYDTTGRFIGPLTEGPWNVMDVAFPDTAHHVLFIDGRGRESGQLKMHSKLYKVRTDGTGLTLLTPEKGNHSGNFSPDGRFFVDTYSSIDDLPRIVLRSAVDGKIIRELERATTAGATAIGWKPPELVTLTANDGLTPIYAVMWRPTNFDSTKRYPIVDHIYPMPLGGQRDYGFNAPSSEQQALAELGFLVVQIDPRGIRDPSPAIRNYYRTQFGGRYLEATLAEHVEALKQIGARYRYVDLARVGLYGLSGGGAATAQGLLRYPDFFKVGVAFAGNHDDRTESTIVGESWRGFLRRDATGHDNYEGDANYLLARNLKGKLMLVHGDLDESVPTYNTIRLASALIDAGKRFDMMILPDGLHATGGWYGSRLMFDYFVRNLLGYEVPEYTFTGVQDPFANTRRRGARTP